MRTLLLFLYSTLLASTLAAQNVEPPFDADYVLDDLGQPVGIPGNLGGLAMRWVDPYDVYLVGSATRADAAVYRVRVTRDGRGHITGFAEPALWVADAPDADGGLEFGRRGVLFFTRYSNNQLGQIRPGSSGMDKSVPLGPLGVVGSVGGLAFVPPGYPNAGELTLLSFNLSRSYGARLAPDGDGTFDVLSVTDGLQISGGPEGYRHIPPGSPQFDDYSSVVVCEWGAFAIAAYDLDATGHPLAATRRVLVSDLAGAMGAAIDPYTGDLLVSLYGGSPGIQNHVFALRGFNARRPLAFPRGNAPFPAADPILR